MNLLTTGEIARRLDVDRDAVSYAIRKLRIKPAGVAGNIRIFCEEVVREVQAFLESKANSQEYTDPKDSGSFERKERNCDD